MKNLRGGILLVIALTFSIGVIFDTTFPVLPTEDKNDPGIILSANTVAFDYEGQFNFSSEEHIINQYPWQETDLDLSFSTPADYDTLNGSIVFECQNASITVPDFHEDPDATTYEFNDLTYAQAWNTSISTHLLDFSFHVDGRNKETQFDMEIRKESPSGTRIFDDALWVSTPNDWVTYVFDTPLFLESGKYYLVLKSEGGAQFKSLSRSLDGKNDSETWSSLSFDDNDWDSCNFDICMKLNLTQYLLPEAIDLQLGGLQVKNYESMYGRLDLDLDLTQTSFPLNITTNTSSNIQYRYRLDADFSRHRALDYHISSLGSNFEWNLTMVDPPEDFEIQNYELFISGLQTDYANMELMSGNISHSFEILDQQTLHTTSQASNLIFSSPNYVASFIVPDSLVYGDNLTLHLECAAIGEISIHIINHGIESTLYSLSDVQRGTYEWYIDPSVHYNLSSINVVFYGDNEVGYLSLPVSLLSKGNIVAENYAVQALDEVEILCQYIDQYSSFPIDGAKVSLNIDEIQCELSPLGEGWYSCILDLDQYGFGEGNYSVQILAQKSGISSAEFTLDFEIAKRTVDLDLIVSNSRIKPGEEFQYMVSLRDTVTQEFLLRPVSIQVEIFSEDSSRAAQTIFFEQVDGLISTRESNWTLPANIQKGTYSIHVNIVSDFYVGSAEFLHVVQIVRPLAWYVYILPMLGLLAIGSTTFFFYQEKVKQSILGVIALHNDGMPIAQQFSEMIVQEDMLVVSAAFTGVLSIIKEITGSQTRVIEIEGGYLNITKEEGFWIILLSKMHPRLISPTISKFVLAFKIKYITAEVLEKGFPIQVEFVPLIESFFHVNLDQRNSKGKPKVAKKDEPEDNLGPGDGVDVSLPSDSDLDNNSE